MTATTILILLGIASIVVSLLLCNAASYASNGTTWPHLRRATGALLFVAFLILAYSLEAHACRGYPQQPEPAQIACAVC